MSRSSLRSADASADTAASRRAVSSSTRSCSALTRSGVSITRATAAFISARPRVRNGAVSRNSSPMTVLTKAVKANVCGTESKPHPSSTARRIHPATGPPVRLTPHDTPALQNALRRSTAALTSALVAVGLLALLASRASASVGDLSSSAVVFRGSGGTLLHGVVVAPRSAGHERPGIVLVGGSGPDLGSAHLEEADAFARGGVVTLVYDKRTAGYSVFERSFSMLAEDALAAVRVLRTHAGVDPARVGIWGVQRGRLGGTAGRTAPTPTTPSASSPTPGTACTSPPTKASIRAATPAASLSAARWPPAMRTW